MTPKQINALYEDIRSSFKLAMASEGIPANKITIVMVTVDDYIDNHYDEDWNDGKFETGD